MATLKLTNGNDLRTIIENGTYVIDGLAGTDTISYGIQPRSFFEISRNTDGSIQIDTVSGASGGGMRSTLYNIEKLEFNNGLDKVDVAALFPEAVVTGTAGNDSFSAKTGTQTIDGAAGIDTVSFSLSRINYLLNKTGADWTVNATAGNASTTLRNIERLSFADTKLALDLNGDAGEVAKILGAVFDSPTLTTTDYKTFAGIGLGFTDAGMSYVDLMQLALDARLGPNASPTAVVNLLYTNVVGVAPSPADLDFFVGQLNNGTFTPATLGILAADHELNLVQINFTGLALNGLGFI